MITKADIRKVLEKRTDKQITKLDKQFKTALGRIEKWVKEGRIVIPNAGNDPTVQKRIKETLARQGIIATFETKTTKADRVSPRGVKKYGDYTTTTVRLSIKE